LILRGIVSSGPGGRSFKSSLPDHSFSSAINDLGRVFRDVIFLCFRYIRYKWRQFEAETTLPRPLSPEGSVLFDLVVEGGHGVVGVSHPKLQETLGTSGSIPEMRVAETSESVVARLAGSGKRVDESELLQHRVKMPAKNVGRAKRLSIPGTEQKPADLMPENSIRIHRLLHTLALVVEQPAITTNRQIPRASLLEYPTHDFKAWVWLCPAFACQMCS